MILSNTDEGCLHVLMCFEPEKWNTPAGTLYLYFHTILLQSKILHPFFPDRVYSKMLQGSTYQCAVYHSQIVSQSDR